MDTTILLVSRVSGETNLVMGFFNSIKSESFSFSDAAGGVKSIGLGNCNKKDLDVLARGSCCV